MQRPQDCATAEGCCILQQALQKPLQPLQWPLLLQNEDAVRVAEAARVGLRVYFPLHHRLMNFTSSFFPDSPHPRCTCTTLAGGCHAAAPPACCPPPPFIPTLPNPNDSHTPPPATGPPPIPPCLVGGAGVSPRPPPSGLRRTAPPILKVRRRNGAPETRPRTPENPKPKCRCLLHHPAWRRPRRWPLHHLPPFSALTGMRTKRRRNPASVAGMRENKGR
jgi:hypothetical protein